MQQAKAKYQEALAHEIAEALKTAPQAAGRVETYYDEAGNTWAVRVCIDDTRYELLMPAPGALYSLFCNGTWLGGISRNGHWGSPVTSASSPVEVAIALLERIGATTH